MEKIDKILILIDCQNDFITGSLRNEEAIKVVPNIVEKINNFDGNAIFYTMDTHNEKYLDSMEGKKLPIEHCIFGTDGYKLQADIQKALENIKKKGVEVNKINKPTFGSIFMAESIDKHYKNKLDIEIVGFVSSICVISNALILKSYLYDRADISVDKSCIAGLNDYNNEAAIEVMKLCQIEIIND